MLVKKEKSAFTSKNNEISNTTYNTRRNSQRAHKSYYEGRTVGTEIKTEALKAA